MAESAEDEAITQTSSVPAIVGGTPASIQTIATIEDTVSEQHLATTTSRKPRRFHGAESARKAELDGVLLATFWQRVLGYFVDLILVVIVWAPLEFLWRNYMLHESRIDMKWDFHEPGNVVVAIIYFGLTNYFGNGRTPGKWVSRTRAVSLTSERMGRWQSVERALGYGAAVLEFGLGFLQFFWDHNRMCAQDRLAETIVIDTRIRKSPTPDLLDDHTHL